MRILFLTNYFPPHELGGQGRSCQQVMQGMQSRGHETLVLTSMHGTANKLIREKGVVRALYPEMDLVPWRNAFTFFSARRRREAHNIQCFKEVVADFRPDVIFIWGMWNMPRSLPAAVEAAYPQRVLYRFAEYWPTLPSQHEEYWRTPGRTLPTRLLKGTLRPFALASLARDNDRPPLRFPHAFCVSMATRNHLVANGLPLSGARVIHTGLDATPYLPNRWQANENGTALHYGLPAIAENEPMRVLYAGRLTAEKGVHVLLAAWQQVVRGYMRDDVHLQIAGSGEPAYEEALRTQVAKAGMADSVEFLGRVPEEEMPALYRRQDVLVVPSTWPEPFARVLLEGMAAGLAVVATTVGGNSEAIRHQRDGLLVRPGDSMDLAFKLLHLADHPEERELLGEQGRQKVLETFSEARMLDQIEAILREVICGGPISGNGHYAAAHT